MTIPPLTHVRCTLCGTVLPGWLRIPDVPNSAMLLHHLVEVKPYLTRMEVECIDTVVMDLFERVDA